MRRIALRPTSAVLPYARDGVELRAAGEALGVDHLLVGTVQRAGSQVRVSVQLVRARDRVALWARVYDVAAADLLRLQDDVAEQIAAALRVELTAAERERMRRRTTDDPAAFASYLRGRALLAEYTEARMREAIVTFEQAVARDPRYAQARAALAVACAWFSVRFAYEAEAAAWGERAEGEARAALAEDDALADAHLALAWAAGTSYRGFDWATVFRETAIALSLDAAQDLAHVGRMRAYYHLGRFDDARREGRLARALNPNPSVEIERLEVAIDLFGGEFARAAERAAPLLGRTDAPAVRLYLGLARFYLGDVDGAKAVLAAARRGGRPDVRAQAALASIEAASGEAAAARRRLEEILAGPYMDHHVAYSVGVAFAQLGAIDEALAWLMRAVDTGFPCAPWFEHDRLLAPLRGDARFERLVAETRAAARRDVDGP